MGDAARAVLAALDGLGIKYELIQHEAASSIEDCRPIGEALKAPILKNLFLTTRRKGGFYLLVTRPDESFQSGTVSRQAGTSRLCFAGEEPLLRLLRTRPGSISPLGLMFDAGHEVTLLMDAALKDYPRLAFHPCENTQSLAMDNSDFFGRFLPFTEHEPHFVELNQPV